MEAILHGVLLATQYIAIFVLFGEIIYISFLKPSRFQVEMILLLFSTLVMLLGYTIELYATDMESALNGAALAYVGKPFALLMSLVFIADYCNRPLPAKVIVPIAFFGMVTPVVLFTNGAEASVGHHWYYATVDFDINRIFSPLILSRGPLYYVYTAYLIIMFSVILYYIGKEFFKTRSKETRNQLIYLFAMMAATIAGYVIYLTGLTKGYDTTMTGAAVGTLCLTVVFFKYRLFDSLTLAKEHALRNASTGLLVLNERNQSVYTNAGIERWLPSLFTFEELISMEDGQREVQKGNFIFKVSKTSIEKKGVAFGKTIEIDDITAQYNYHVQLQHDVEERTKEIHNIQRSVIASFAGIVEARDHSTGIHIKRMSRFVELIAKEMQDEGVYPEILKDSYVARLVEAAPLHDIGKLTIPDSILNKPGRLTEEEFEVIKTHSAEGARILKECLDGVEKPAYVELACDIAHFHHEKWDGSGYPEHLAGEQIPLCARIVAVADVYDAVRSERCYKAAMDPEQAKDVIVSGNGTHFDPRVVEAFLKVFDKIEEQ